MDLGVSGAIEEAENPSVLKESEEAAAAVIKARDAEEGGSAASLAAPETITADAPQAPSVKEGKPLVDPPEFGERVQDIYNKDPYWVPGAFPGIFQKRDGRPVQLSG